MSAIRPAARYVADLQRRQRVGEMDVHRLLGFAHRRRGVLVALQLQQHRVQLIQLTIAQPITLTELGQRRWSHGRTRNSAPAPKAIRVTGTI